MSKIYITKKDTIIGEIDRNDLPMSNNNIYECLKELVKLGLFKDCGKRKSNYYVEVNDDE